MSDVPPILSPAALAEWTPAWRREFAARFPRSWQQISDMLRLENHPPTLPDDMTLADRIITLCAHSDGITIAELKGPRRHKTAAHARMAAMALIYKHCPHFSLPMIGRKLGGRDHSTVIHARNRVNADLASGGVRFGAIVRYVEARLR